MFRVNTCNLTVIEIIHVLSSRALDLSFGTLQHKEGNHIISKIKMKKTRTASNVKCMTQCI